MRYNVTSFRGKGEIEVSYFVREDERDQWWGKEMIYIHDKVEQCWRFY